MTKLSALKPIRGNKTSLFNAGDPQTVRLTDEDFAKLSNIEGELDADEVGGRWHAYVDGWCYVVKVETVEELNSAAIECAAIRDRAIMDAMSNGLSFDDAVGYFTEVLAAKDTGQQQHREQVEKLELQTV
jgi:hypothetical protein